MKPYGFFVLLDPLRGYWTGRKWTEDLGEAQRFAGPRTPYTRARAAAERLLKRGRGSPIVAYVEPPEINPAQIPENPSINPAGGEN